MKRYTINFKSLAPSINTANIFYIPLAFSIPLAFNIPTFGFHCKIGNRVFYSTGKGEEVSKINSVKFYPDAYSQNLEILNENLGKSGIYMWKNKNNGKFYIGSSNNLKRRLTSYFNLNYIVKESSMYINRALLKEGYSAFSLYILEHCDEKDLIKREQYYFYLLKPTYNICTTAGSTLGRLHEEKAKEKISESKKGTYSGKSNHFYGKTHTLDAKGKMVQAKLFKVMSE